MNIGAFPSSPIESEHSVFASYPSIIYPIKNTYEFAFSDGNVAISSGMMTRLCQEGHIFKLLVFGGNGFRDISNTTIIQTLQYYGITKRSFQALIFSLRTNNANVAYKYRLIYESICGFKTIDKHHMKRMNKKKEKSNYSSCNSNNSNESNNSNNYNSSTTSTTYRTTINLISDDEDDLPV